MIPVYNGGGLLAEGIESVYAQSVVPDEVIVVDDGSTDETALILTQFEGRPGFSWFRTPHRGQASARNIGLERATGDYVALLDHDDLWRPDKLERQLAQFDRTWGMSFTAYERTTPTSCELIDHDTWDPDPQVVLGLLERRAAIGTCSTWLVRRDALRRVGPFENVLPFGVDWLMTLRFVAAGNEVGYLAEPLTEYRWHGSNISRDDNGQFLDTACAVFDLYGNRRLRAWWRLNNAIAAQQRGDRTRARRRILEAARICPQAARPGWIKLLL